MSEASSNTALFAQNYPLLLGLGGGLALGLMALIGYQLVVLRRKLRERVFGSKLTLRLMVVFALMALDPGRPRVRDLVPVPAALDRIVVRRARGRVARRAACNLARSALENSLQGARPEGRVAWRQSLATSQAVEAATLNRLREQYGVEEATLLQPARQGHRLQSGAEPVALLPRPARARTCCARCARSSPCARSRRFPTAASTCA